MVILGINAYHADSAACLLVDGTIEAAAEEERFRRVKHWAGFPSEAISFCLKDQGLNLSDLQVVALNTDPSAARLKKLRYMLSGNASVDLVLEKLRTRNRRQNIHQNLNKHLGPAKFTGDIKYVEHHLAHLASAYLVSPYSEAVMLSVDGFGDFCSTAWGLGKANHVAIEDRIYFPHSLGVFYQAMTQFLGFQNYGDEYKVMGLASYGHPKYVDQVSSLVSLDSVRSFRLNLEYFLHHRIRAGYMWENGVPQISNLFSDRLAEVLGVPSRKPGEKITQMHKDLANSTQTVYENIVFALMRNLHELYGNDNLTLSGGCAMNSVANGKIYKKTPFRSLYVQPAPGDAGGAIGAALVAYSDMSNEKRPGAMDHAYIGPMYTDQNIEEEVISVVGKMEKSEFDMDHIGDQHQLTLRTAQALAAGNIVGWFQGRMEWGPRALGNRSILCDPRRENIREILNRKIKRRESFRPFAPSILREEVSEWFEDADDVPYMEKVFQIIPQQRCKIPGVTHVDGSGRLQTVTRESNSLYYNLIETFRSITGVPILLNTSFNENEPIVCSPKEALDTFLRTNMDVLVLGNYYLTRSG